MVNQSADSTISLPKGGGALQGMGEKFAADLFTGTGNFTVPLALPAGRNGLQPQLTLAYSTGNGNGSCGLGWDLGVAAITRKTSRGIPRYQDQPADVFVISGGEDLVPINTANGITRYRPRTEGPFSLIDHVQVDGTNHWEVRAKDGSVTYFGTPKPTDVAPGWEDPAVIADPADRSKIFSWKLTRTEDPFGNHILYEYERDSAQQGPHHWDQLYLKRIRYVDYTTDAGELAYLVSITLHFEDRSDAFSQYRAGFEIRTRKRCHQIDVHTQADEVRLARRYHLSYLDQRIEEIQAALEDDDLAAFHDTFQAELDELEAVQPLNGVSLLNRVKVIGHDGDRTEEMPALQFNYSKFEPENRDFFPITMQGQDIPLPLDRGDVEMVDLFGNGLPDLLQMNGTVRYWRNQGNGRYDLPRLMSEAPAGVSLTDPGVQMLDADGDGRADLLVTQPQLSGYFPLRFGGLWDRRSFQKYEAAPSFNLEDAEVQLVDLTGDGVTDAIRSGFRLECFFNDPENGWDGVRMVERRAIEVFPNVNFSDPRVRFSDLTGDGLQDIVLIYDGNVNYWPNLGYGNWGERIEMRNSPHFPLNYDPQRILIGDVDGDGLADIVYVDHESVFLYINQSGNGWSDPIEIDGTPDMTSADSVRLTDVLGSGISGILWSLQSTRPGRGSMFFLNIAGDNKPYLLREMNNNMGAITRVRYDSSTRFYLDDQTRPETRWKTPLPFPVNVVSCVEVFDEISGGKLTTEYFYHHGYWDGTEREFRGFGRVTQRDTEVFDDYHRPGLHEHTRFETVDQRLFSLPVETRTWFHQGPVGDVFSGFEESDFSGEYWQGDPTCLERPADTTALLQNLPSQHCRDALRTLRGTVLRTELYALDGSTLQDRPYTVSESVFGLREEAGPANADMRIFFPHARGQRVTQWERGDDPMTHFSFTDAYDAFGQPTEQVEIACPRGWRNVNDRIPANSPFLASHSQTAFAYSNSETPYIKDRAARTRSFELKHQGDKRVMELKNEVANPSALELIAETLNYYDGEAFIGLPLGDMGPFGVVVRVENIVLTEDVVQQAYGPSDIPTYLVPGTPPNWTADYPTLFRDQTPALAGFTFYDGTGPESRGYFTAQDCARFDFHDDPNGRGLPLVRKDHHGMDTVIAYDTFDLLPVVITDPAGLSRRAVIDYRVLKPFIAIDNNDNRTQIAFTPLGFVESIAVMGKDGEGIGDTVAVPSKRLEYNFLSFQNSPVDARQPVHVVTFQREYHVLDENVPDDLKDNTIINVVYSDGFGRSIQTRKQSDDVRFGVEQFGSGLIPADQTVLPGSSIGRLRTPADPVNVVVSGWQIYNNKGQVVEQYEPYFSTGFGFAPPTGDQLGQNSSMFYDPRGQLIQTTDPNGAFKLVVFGIPRQLDRPDDYVPSPWEAYSYDSNDNAPAFAGNHRVSASHWHTPASIEIDALCRIVKNVAHVGMTEAEKLITLSEYDIRGNLLSQTDAAGRQAFRYVYDLSSGENGHARMLREESIDGGTRLVVFDSIGLEIERRDSKGALVLQAYDEINRPTHLWARDQTNLPVTLRQRLVYGDKAGLNQPEDRNLNGKLFQHFDEAGMQQKLAYNFQNQLVSQTRQMISDAAIVAAMNSNTFAHFQIDWDSPGAEAMLDPRVFQIDMALDALQRLKHVIYPEDVTGDRKVLQPRYNRGGDLQSMTLLSNNQTDAQIIVRHVAYDARGQRNLICYGNNLMTRYAYEIETNRVDRMRTERYREDSPFAFVQDGGLIQDLGYQYDLIGNLIRITDRSPGSGLPNTALGQNALNRTYEYDALYRLILAEGREHNSRDPSAEPWLDTLFPTNPNVDETRPYVRRYAYDKAGNLTEMRHSANNGAASFTRDFDMLVGSNRAQAFSQTGLTFTNVYDARGNMTRQGTSRHFHWNHLDQLHAFRIQAGGGPSSLEARYLYDAAGQRSKKVVRRQNGSVETTTYIGYLFEYRSRGAQENNTLHISDDRNRIAEIRVGNALPGDTGPANQFHLPDHLGSSVVTADETGAMVSHEEYYPFGGTSFGSHNRKRYSFTGKERDEESGLNYHGARYYAPWLMRWMSADPAGRVDGLNLYRYGRNNPLSFLDPSGTEPIKPPDDEGDWDWDIGGRELNIVWRKTEIIEEEEGEKSWVRRAFGFLWKWTKKIGVGHWDAAKLPFKWTFAALGTIWDKTKEYAGNIWGWAKQHLWLAGGAAVGVATLGIIFRESLWNWVLAPAIRMATNAALGYAIGSTFGSTGGKIGAIFGAATGLVHGVSMAAAGTYDWGGWGWLFFVADNSWSLFNSGLGSIFAVLNVGWNSIDRAASEGSGNLHYEDGWSSDYATTIGNVTVGQQVPVHERVHAHQARLLGPAYIPLVLLNFEVNTLLPWWLLFGRNTGDCESYFIGVYRNTWHEAIAYGVDGSAC